MSSNLLIISNHQAVNRHNIVVIFFRFNWMETDEITFACARRRTVRPVIVELKSIPNWMFADVAIVSNLHFLFSLWKGRAKGQRGTFQRMYYLHLVAHFRLRSDLNVEKRGKKANIAAGGHQLIQWLKNGRLNI